MKYLSAQELLKDCRDDAHEILVDCVGKSIRDNFAIKVFDQYYGEFFKDYNQRLLDLGPASGGFIRQISEAGYSNLYGVDLDDYRRDENKKLFKEFKTADLSWDPIPWPDKFFNVVTAWCVLPHLENPFYAAREVHRVLKKGGLFIMTTPHLISKPSIDYFVEHKDFGSYRASNNHLVPFTRGLVQKTILKYFDLFDTEYHFRTKIFDKGLRGKVRKILYKAVKAISPKLKKSLAKRWSYNIVYILKKK